MTAGELYGVVRDLVNRPGAAPIATSDEVKRTLTERGIMWDRSGRSGGFLEKADQKVLLDGRLARWKHGTGPNDEVGWSISEKHNPEAYTRAVEYANAHGWRTSIKF